VGTPPRSGPGSGAQPAPGRPEAQTEAKAGQQERNVDP